MHIPSHSGSVSAPNIVNIATTDIFQQVAYYRWSDLPARRAMRVDPVTAMRRD